ncbi:MAG: Gfo/Idh/MocA family oxidoreductase [Planctomycetota bacterium]|jgi:predicted dehydrogenase|nr:Gfo/Idh/MocA family oxidoreductase [Planctomycetota bacterium]
MANAADGMNYAPKGKPNPVVKEGEFPFAVIGLDHGHINGQCNGLLEAGATLTKVYDPDPAKVAAFIKSFPQAKAAESKAEILEDDAVKMVAAAAIPNQRGALGCEVMRHGKDYFTDKCPFTTLGQLEEAKKVIAETKQKYMVYFSERLHVESAMFAGELVHDKGAIGKVVQVIGLGPHRLGSGGRPDWFFNREEYGGILTDIGSHQLEQFLYYTGATDAKVLSSAIANYDNPDHPELDDWGQVTVVGDNGATGYHRVDWFTPDGLRSWGDGRLFLLGTEGYIELRKYVDPATETQGGDHVLLVDKKGEHRFQVNGQVGFRFFGELIKDCINRTEIAMTQAHAFKAAELCLQAQAQAVVVATDGGRPAAL